MGDYTSMLKTGVEIGANFRNASFLFASVDEKRRHKQMLPGHCFLICIFNTAFPNLPSLWFIISHLLAK